jgi:hypothetical protein
VRTCSDRRLQLMVMYVPGKETVWLGVPVCKLPTHGDILLLPASSTEYSSLRLLSELVDFESLGGYAVEPVAGVSCADIDHKWTCVCSHFRQKTHAFPPRFPSPSLGCGYIHGRLQFSGDIEMAGRSIYDDFVIFIWRG